MQSSSGSTSTTITRHIPVLLQPVLEVLSIQPADIVLDGTLGGGGHARAMADLLSHEGTLIGLDVDADARRRAADRLLGVSCTVHIIDANFRKFDDVLPTDTVDKALFDLGWSSDQLEVANRGFSLMRDEPLLMTLVSDVTDETLTAHDVVNGWQEETLADIIYGWGQERNARKIARAIVEARPINTTGQLAAVIESVVPRRGRLHPATKTFQALRIAVNDELGALQELLEKIPQYVTGAAAIITFHSLEDSLVKNAFRRWEREGLGTRITKKPLTADADEVGHNPRSRSAKLRAFAFTHNVHTHR